MVFSKLIKKYLHIKLLIIAANAPGFISGVMAVWLSS